VSANTPSFHIASPMAMGLIIGGTNNTNFVSYYCEHKMGITVPPGLHETHL